MLPATNRGAGGTLNFPDVCLTPMVPSPVPIPYPDLGMTAMAVPFSPNVLLTFVNALNMGSSEVNPIVFINFLPGIMLCAPSAGNNFNAPIGATLIPSITNVFFTRDTRRAAAFRVEGARIVVGEIEAATPTRVFTALRDLDGGAILDLRGNPGGVPDAALQLADDCLADCLLLARRVDADGDVIPLRGRRRQAHRMPLAVLVDEMTASAAEILAGVLQFHGRARIFGCATFGKASAGKLKAGPDGEPRMVEVAEFRLPDGTRISGRGIDPDVVTDDPETEAWAWLRM